VQSAEVVEDRGSGQSRGFGFVEMGSDMEAGHAIAALNGEELDGLALTVIEARPRAPWPGSGPGGSNGPVAGATRAGRQHRDWTAKHA